jgi:hypothetical protein
MKAKVLREFKDKHSVRIHKAGDTLTISKERFNEILSVAPLVEEIKKEKPTV